MKMDKCEYRWQFFRRNEEYIEDCKRWSDRKGSEWRKNEIIIGFPIKYRKNQDLRTQHKNYYRRNWDVFKRLTFSPYKIEKYKDWLRYKPDNERLKEVIDEAYRLFYVICHHFEEE